MEDVYPDAFLENRAAPLWELANELMVKRLGGFGDVWVTVFVEGGRFPQREDTAPIVMRRGPLPPGVDPEQVSSLGREMLRATGGLGFEP
jgi:hypothetical protein